MAWSPPAGLERRRGMRVRYEEHFIRFRFEPEDWEGSANIFLAELRVRVALEDLELNESAKSWKLARAEWEPIFKLLRARYFGVPALLELFAEAA